ALWDVATRRRRATLRGHSSLVYNVAIAPDGKTLASAGKDGAVKFWALPAPPLALALARTLSPPEAQVWFATFSPDGKVLATGSGDKTVRLWDAATMQPRGVLEGHESGVSRGLFTADGKTLITSSWDKTIKVWDLGSKTERHSLQ